MVQHVALFFVSKTEINNDYKRRVTSYEGGRRRQAFRRRVNDRVARAIHTLKNAKMRARMRNRDTTETGRRLQKTKGLGDRRKRVRVMEERSD